MNDLSEARRVVELLRRDTLLCRVAVATVDASLMNQADVLSQRLDIARVDCAAVRLEMLRKPNPPSLGNWDSSIEVLESVCARSNLGSAVLVLNWDLLMARLLYEDRQHAWRFLQSSFKKRKRGLLILMPQGASALLPSESELVKWRAGGRLVRL